MPKNQFEIPQELRHLAEENVERTRQLYLQFVDGVSQAMGARISRKAGGYTEHKQARQTRRPERSRQLGSGLPVP